jgi:hypothetical protein
MFSFLVGTQESEHRITVTSSNRKEDKEIIVTKSDFESRQMTHFYSGNTRVKKNEYNVPEPTGIEVPSKKKIEVGYVVHFLGYDKFGNYELGTERILIISFVNVTRSNQNWPFPFLTLKISSDISTEKRY